MTQLRIAQVVQDSIVDDPGLRCTVFVQGCPHRCIGGHNSQTWATDADQWVEVEELVQLLRANPLLSGLTLSGGEPTAQPAGCADLAEAAHRLGLDVWCYTGCTWEQLQVRARREPDIRRLLAQIDVLVDGPFLIRKRSLTLPWRGSTNQRLLDVPASLAAHEPVAHAC